MILEDSGQCRPGSDEYLKFWTVVVGGIELSGMSTMVVNPPAAAADVAVAKPSHSVRPERNGIFPD